MDARSPSTSVDDFHRIRLLPPYVFEEVNRLKAALRRGGADVIDFGMGNPDGPTPQHVLDKLVETAKKPRTNRYSASRGIAGLRRAIAGHMERRFGVRLDPDRQVIATLGSKEGFANLAQAITAPGDVILAPDPAYPIHAFGFTIAGGAVTPVPAPDPDTFAENLGRTLAQSTDRRPVAMVVNYPSNPTAQVAGLDFYREIVALARRYDVLVLSDLAYSEIYFGDEPPASILQIEGADQVAVELHSLSKSYNMAGFRIGFAVGQERMIAALARVKSYLDYGGYTPLQVAGACALDGPQDCVAEIRQTYKARAKVLVEAFAAAGWAVPAPAATMFAWAPIPERFRADGALAFSKWLLEKAHVAVAPGSGFGAAGEGHVRLGLVENEQRIRQAARKIKAALQS